MKKPLGFYLTALLILCPTFVLAQNSKKIRLNKKSESSMLPRLKPFCERIFRHWTSFVQRILPLIIRVARLAKEMKAVKELIRSGVINNASFVREIELVLIHGKTIIVMGHETLVQMKILRRQVKPCVAATQTFG